MPITHPYQIEKAFRDSTNELPVLDWEITGGPGSMTAFSDSWPQRHNGQQLHVSLSLARHQDQPDKREYVRWSLHMYTLISLDHSDGLIAFAARRTDFCSGSTPTLLVGWYNIKTRTGMCNWVLD